MTDALKAAGKERLCVHLTEFCWVAGNPCSHLATRYAELVLKSVLLGACPLSAPSQNHLGHAPNAVIGGGYISHFTFGLDLSIILKTLYVMLFARGR